MKNKKPNKDEKRKERVNALIAKAMEIVVSYGPDPEDKLLMYTKSELERIQAMVNKQWPLSKEDQDTVRIGLFAVRSLEGVLDRLADALHELSSEIHHDYMKRV